MVKDRSLMFIGIRNSPKQCRIKGSFRNILNTYKTNDREKLEEGAYYPPLSLPISLI